ncbi:tail fiber domain-containing protein [[Clostridium] innocuum]|nr:tail fiber domain-containing protein [[Clostridium] innocuum]
MKLSNDLISQFVKTTADNDTTKKETTVYGTVVKQGSNVFVKLDGSELLTPASSTTVVKNGERVTVMIKNHTAVITGNISSPAAQDNDVKEVGSKISEFEIIIAGKVSTTEFEAEKARINSVVADNVLIKNKLTANDATIGKLETDYLAVNGKLTAVEGDISILRTKKLDAEIATITYATIANLEATNIKVNNLESTYGDFKDLVTEKLRASEAEITDLKAKKLDVESADLLYAKIGDFTAISGKVDFMEVGLEKVNTLISGNVTAGSTDTIVLNASNTTIENALIKSAMVESLTFDKITGIDINTTKLTVHSNDGKSKWMDNTIQISDSKRIRVQIGKDASGDYNMYVWDAAGKLMFDATGITASGIQRPIIVDSMVADNANISGDKINITSLVKEINDGTEVIKSSHILVDGANQSLSVVYNTITGDISTLSTALSVEQGKISSLITDVSQAKGDVSTLQTNYSSLTQTVLGINSTVSSHSTSIDNLNNMEIGGRNLITNTRPDKAAVNHVTSKWSVQIVDEATAISGKAMQETCTQAGTGGFYHVIPRKLDPGKRYTWAVYIKSSKNVRLSTGSEQGGQRNCEITTEWKRFVHTFTALESAHYQFTFYTADSTVPWAVGDIVWYHSLILVEGDKAQTWVPAPEDMDASIKTVSDKTSTLEQTVNGFDARITSATSTASNALTKATELSATVDGYNIRITNAESNANTALSKTNTLEQKVTATSLITTISSGISGGTALSTTKFVMDASGLHIKNGGFDISNNAGTKVFSADTAGNLSITAAINAASGKIGKFTLNDGLIYEGQSTYKGISGQVTEKYYFNISPNSAHKDVGNVERNFVSSWTLPLLKVNTSGENSFEVYPDGFLQSRQIKMGDGVVEGTLYFGSSQYSNSAFINSGGNIWAAGGVQAKNFVAANGQGLRVLNSSGVPTTLIYTDSSDNARIPNNNFIVSKAMTVNGSLHAKAASWIGSNYSTGGWIGIYDSYGGTRKGYIGYGTATETQFNIYNNEGAHNGVALDATANGNWTHGRFIPLYGGMALGSSSNRWYRLYSSAGCDTSSDIRLKNSIRGYDDRYEAMYMDMQPVTFELNAVPGQRQGGLIAQWTKDAMTKHGITDSEFGAYNYHPEDDTYGIIYEQLTSLNMHMIQKTIKRMDKHDEEISKLKQENEELKAKLNAYIKGELEVRTCLL